MNNAFRIETAWENAGASHEDPFDAPEDMATLGKIVVSNGNSVLTRAVSVGGEPQEGPVASACRLAEWIAWHWWRLLWEPSNQSSVEWVRAHDMACIGGGWLWPNITMSSDGYRVILHAKPSSETPTEPLRYTQDIVTVMSSSEFENGAKTFIRCVIDRLSNHANGDSFLCKVWRELSDDINKPDAFQYRKTEALLGFDPDQGDSRMVEAIMAGANDLGQDAVDELAADIVIFPTELRRVAQKSGISANPGDGVSPIVKRWNRTGTFAPWRVGVAAAQELRDREISGGQPIDDELLADMYGVSAGVLRGRSRQNRMTFSMEGNAREAVVLRPCRRTARRFALARMLGDRLLVETQDRLRPATQAATYRQKMQRAFAAELLCPIESLIEEMKGDYSEDGMEAAATKFMVSPWLVHTQLAKHDLVSNDRPGLSEQSVVLAA